MRRLPVSFSRRLNDRGLALRLRQYGIKSKQVRIGDVTLKGYEWADFIDVWKRYLPPPPPSDTSETRETSETSEKSQGTDVSDVSDALAANVSDVSLVSLVGEGRGGNGSPPLCDHCGTPGRLNPYDWPSRPSGIVLHSSCEGPWWDSEGARQ